MPYPDGRAVGRALATLERLPTEALADLAERLIDRLDAVTPDPDLEAEEDCCTASECGGLRPYSDGLPGEPDDAEPEEDQNEPLLVDRRGSANLPVHRRLRAERDGLVKVWRRSSRTFTSRGMAPLAMELRR